MPAPLLLDLTHTSHTRARTGIQRVARSLHAALGEHAIAITHDPHLGAWRPLQPWENANLSADKIRTMLAEANGRLRKASAEYFDLLEKGLGSSPLPVAGQAKQFCDYMQRNVTATFDFGDKLIQAEDMQDAAKIQSEFFQDQMRSLTDHARSMGESAMKAATGVFTPKG